MLFFWKTGDLEGIRDIRELSLQQVVVLHHGKVLPQGSISSNLRSQPCANVGTEALRRLKGHFGKLPVLEWLL